MKFLLAFALLLSVGCASAETKMNHLNLGMTKNEVIEVMGTPDSTKARDNIETLVYIHEGTFWTWGHGVRPTREYWAILKDGKLAQYGLAGDFGSSVKPTEHVVIDKN
jgi:hypothetical protein